MRFLFLAAFLSAAGLTSGQTPASSPMEVMILGTFHLGNPGQDLHNVKADSVLTPDKQAELADLAGRLSEFHPTKIAVEGLSSRSDLVWPKFEKFSAAKLTQDPDERIQIACRLALQLGQKTSTASTNRATRSTTFRLIRSRVSPPNMGSNRNWPRCRERWKQWSAP